VVSAARRLWQPPLGILLRTGKRVLVLDLDLESPGLSSSLLPPDRQPMYGITDWLIEDLVDNADIVFRKHGRHQ